MLHCRLDRLDVFAFRLKSGEHLLKLDVLLTRRAAAIEMLSGDAKGIWLGDGGCHYPSLLRRWDTLIKKLKMVWCRKIVLKMVF